MRWVYDSFFNFANQIFRSTWHPLIPEGERTLYISSGNVIQEDYGSYDYIVFDSFDYFDDIRELLKKSDQLSPRQRLILKTCVPWLQQLKKSLWSVLFSKNILSTFEQDEFLKRYKFQTIAKHKIKAIPLYIPLISWCINIICQLPFLNYFCLQQFVIVKLSSDLNNEYSVSVIIPCKNEKGNIERAVKNIPAMGKYTELIFIEGNSVDGTYEELVHIQKRFSEKNIKILQQDGRGKKEAVKKGFLCATGEVFMILDADLTVDPEDLKFFYEALKKDEGEFINGSRLMYPMEKGAMTWPAYLANHGIGYCLSWLFNQKIKDTLCGTKVFFAKDYQKMLSAVKTFGNLDPFGDFEFLFSAAFHNLKILDMPIYYKTRRYGSSQIARYFHVWFLIGMGVRGIKEFKFRHGN